MGEVTYEEFDLHEFTDEALQSKKHLKSLSAPQLNELIAFHLIDLARYDGGIKTYAYLKKYDHDLLNYALELRDKLFSEALEKSGFLESFSSEVGNLVLTERKKHFNFCQLEIEPKIAKKAFWKMYNKLIKKPLHVNLHEYVKLPKSQEVFFQRLYSWRLREFGDSKTTTFGNLKLRFGNKNNVVDVTLSLPSLFLIECLKIDGYKSKDPHLPLPPYFFKEGSKVNYEGNAKKYGRNQLQEVVIKNGERVWENSTLRKSLKAGSSEDFVKKADIAGFLKSQDVKDLGRVEKVINKYLDHIELKDRKLPGTFLKKDLSSYPKLDRLIGIRNKLILECLKSEGKVLDKLYRTTMKRLNKYCDQFSDYASKSGFLGHVQFDWDQDQWFRIFVSYLKNQISTYGTISVLQVKRNGSLKSDFLFSTHEREQFIAYLSEKYKKDKLPGLDPKIFKVGSYAENDSGCYEVVPAGKSKKWIFLD